MSTQVNLRKIDVLTSGMAVSWRSNDFSHSSSLLASVLSSFSRRSQQPQLGDLCVCNCKKKKKMLCCKVQHDRWEQAGQRS